MSVQDSASGQPDQAFHSMGIHTQHHENHGDVQLPANQGFLSYSTQLPDPFGLRHFYQNSGPWNPLAGVSNAQNTEYNPSCDENYPPSGALLYRNQNPASECDTSLPGADSGYASRLVPSVGQPSRVANDFPEGERMMNLRLDSQPQPGPSSNYVATSKGSSRPRSSSTNHHCPHPGCKVSIKTKSELTKHLHRHDPPFICNLPNCPRQKKGFSTKNDLQRHIRTVHQKLGGDAQTYYCVIGECAKKPTAKPWPRADNFRQHLHRVHNIDKKADEDLTPFLGVPNRQSYDGAVYEGQFLPEAQGSALKGVGSFEELQSDDQPQVLAETELMGEQHNSQQHVSLQSSQGAAPWRSQTMVSLNPDKDESEAMDTRTLSVTNGQEVQSQWIAQPPNQQERIAETSSMSRLAPDTYLGAPSRAEAAEAPNSPASICLEVSTSSIRPEIQQIVNDLPGLLVPKREEPEDAQSIADCLKELLPAETLLLVAQIIMHGAPSGSRSEMGDTKYPFSCDQCHKKFPRQCELKKHKKRHDKPYGCTFKGCDKDFGSKNDWKRHESSQHLQLETWSCDYPGCSKICNRRESFKNHLIREHNQAQDARLEQQLEKRRLGRHCDRQYWCGFCKRIQNITSSNVNCWTVRCDHIDDHICGRGHLVKVSMASWVYLEDQSRPGSPSHGSQPVTVPDPIQVNNGSAKGNRVMKRKNDGSDVNRTKKLFQQTAQDGWVCCSCNDSYNSTHVNVSCTSCDHHHCSNCPPVSFSRKHAQESSA